MSKWKCEFCDYEANTERGLKIHMGRLHKGEVSIKGINQVVKEIKEVPVEEPVVEEPVVEEPVVEEPTPVVAEVTPAVTEPTPVVTEPIPLPHDVGITSIPIGARVMLNGTFWKISEGAYVDATVSNLECLVYDKTAQNDFMYLQLKAIDNTEWCCVESQVTDGTIQLLSLKDPTPPVASKEDVAAKVAYLKACEAYTVARDAKLAAESRYKEVDLCTRPSIIAYVAANGTESDKGTRDRILNEGGFNVHHTFSEGKVTIKRDEAAILAWCTKNGHSYAIKPALDVEAWDALVLKGDVVPAEFLAQVHTPVKAKDARRLLIKGTGIATE